MRKFLKLFGYIAIVPGALLVYAWPYIVMGFAESASYTEQDQREYRYYTPDILKNMPRISSRYDFDYANISGQAFQVYAIKFYNIKNTEKIDNYLSSSGYRKKENCHIEAVCWQGKDPKETITVSLFSEPDTVAVAVNQRY